MKPIGLWPEREAKHKVQDKEGRSGRRGHPHGIRPSENKEKSKKRRPNVGLLGAIYSMQLDHKFTARQN
jgi:hypothetical protein